MVIYQQNAYGVSQQQPRQAPIVAPIVPPVQNRLVDPTIGLRNHPSAVPGAMGSRIHPPVIHGQGRGKFSVRIVELMLTRSFRLNHDEQHDRELVTVETD